MIGYKFAPNWDMAVAGDIQPLFTEVTQTRAGTLTTDTTHQHIDIEVGYSQDWWRLNAGLRGYHFFQRANYYFLPNGTAYDQREIFALGPKIGAGARWPVSNDWAVVTGVNAALLYGSYSDTGTGALLGAGGYSQFVPQLNGELGVNWRSPQSPAFSLTVGPRVAATFNTALTAYGSHQGTWVDCGPYIRFSYNLNGPAPHRAAPVAEAAARRPAAPHTYTAFFDFDDAELSPIALGLIRQAAQDIRRGYPANIRLTGVGEGAGAAPYNIAVSLRRAETVRDELVRHGLAFDQIAVANQNESDPLIATLDGLGDSRNKRVQIVF